MNRLGMLDVPLKTEIIFSAKRLLIKHLNIF